MALLSCLTSIRTRWWPSFKKIGLLSVTTGVKQIERAGITAYDQNRPPLSVITAAGNSRYVLHQPLRPGTPHESGSGLLSDEPEPEFHNGHRKIMALAGP